MPSFQKYICKSSQRFNIIVEMKKPPFTQNRMQKLYYTNIVPPQLCTNYNGKEYPRRYLESTPDSRTSANRPVRATFKQEARVMCAGATGR